MMPAAWVVVEEWPLTPNGKVDRKALPAPERMAGGREYVARETPVEIALAGMWGEVLREDSSRISADADFFELGGDSLQAMQLATRVRRTFGVEVALSELFAAPRLAGFAQRIAAAGQAGITRIGGRGRRKKLPLSYAPPRLSGADRIEGGSSQYNPPVALRVNGEFDPHTPHAPLASPA